MNRDKWIGKFLRYADGDNNRLYGALATRDSTRLLKHMIPSENTIDEIYRQALKTDSYPYPKTISYLFDQDLLTEEQFENIKHSDIIHGSLENLIVYRKNGQNVTYMEAETALNIVLHKEKHYMDPKDKETYLNSNGFFRAESEP